MSKLTILLLTAMVGLIAACSTPQETTFESSSTESQTASTSVSMATSTSEEPTEIPQEALPTETPSPSNQIDFLEYLDRITLITPLSGGGTRPVMEWEPFEGADRYGVYLYAPGDRLYWSWQGRETSVPVGGFPQLREDALGPSIADGMTWMVIAYDADQFPLAASELRPISP